VPKLSDTQLVILSAAVQRGDGAILPLPKSIKARGAALTKLIDALKRNRLITALPQEPGSPIEPVLVITDEGREAIGADTTDTPTPPSSGTAEATVESARNDLRQAQSNSAGSARAGTKLARMVDLLRSEMGATLAEIVEATGWQAHSVRGAISGTLKKKHGLTVTSEKVDGRGRVYRIADGQPSGAEAAS
jgi:hypothetical protein